MLAASAFMFLSYELDAEIIPIECRAQVCPRVALDEDLDLPVSVLSDGRERDRGVIVYV